MTTDVPSEVPAAVPAAMPAAAPSEARDALVPEPAAGDDALVVAGRRFRSRP